MAEWAVLGAVVGLLGGLLSPWVVARIPEPPDRDEDEPSYADIAAERSARLRLAVVGTVALAGIGWARGGSADLAAFLVLGLLATMMIEIDLRRHRLPDRLTGAAAVSGLLVLGTTALVVGDLADIARMAIGAVIFSLVYVVMFLLPGGGVGFGDVKLAPSIGWHLGWLGLGTTVVGVMAGFLVGGLVALVLLLARRVTAKTRIAYGPAILVGAWLAVLFGDSVVTWYLGS